ncbi:Far11p Ecym_8195 [Eremothecium cymbalariae DBVPG|uniref:Factor arrest protein 11 n=1 Tax=Eremothecium cymbalariae (strain CBS 270.75 / DBVPG 7215 / KCTC 17166 / NRRL Y-17582) TaxID=931890 RepID=G8JXA6_ERECY|nr:Hypothetical protein Ecym_8195 [Eremothecium cymbalariae DBVPG\
MPELVRPTSPLIRSLPSQELMKKKQNKKSPYKYTEDVGKYDGTDASTAVEASLLQDLDIILHKKLQMNNTTFDQPGSPGTTNNSSNGTNVGFQMNEEERENDEELEVPGEDEDEDFTNVDEIDGPISPSSSCKVMNDIPSSSASPVCLSPIVQKMKHMPEDSEDIVDENIPIDEDYKKQLDQRAAEISSGFVFHTASKPTLDWSLKAFYSLPEELSEWLDLKDYMLLNKSKASFESKFSPGNFVEDVAYSNECVNTLKKELSEDHLNGDAILAMCYIVFGNFKEMHNLESHLGSIRRNSLLLADAAMGIIIRVFKKQAEFCRDKNSNLSQYNSLLFYSSTVFYFIICVCIETRASDQDIVDKVIDTIFEAGILEFITMYIEHWRWHSRLCMRIRNMLMISFKLLTLQFGDEVHYQKVRTYIHNLHGIETYENRPEKLTASPLDYEAFRIDINSRFPISKALESKIPKDFDNPNSLSQFLEIPRPKAHSAVKMTLPEPQLHIATPVPSPPGSPISPYTPKTRKSFQTNLCYPSLYPSDDEDNTDELESRIQLPDELDNNNVLPYNVQEAIEILSKNIEIKLSVKQLWHERSLFMMQERGWNEAEKHSNDPYDYSALEDNSQEIKTMRRIENYYQKCLPSLISLVYVLLQTIESNLNIHEYFVKDFPADMSIELLTPQLEISRAKEILMRSSSGILFTLLKWFKLSHILKFEYLSSLIYDSKVTDVFIPLLSKFTYNYNDRLYKRTVMLPHSFFAECSKNNLIYRDSYDEKFTQLYPLDSEVNIRMISSEVYMLEVLSKIIGKKTYRLKELPLNIGTLFCKLYQIFNLDIYRPILRLVKELTPFKNKRWKSEHIELISGVYLYEKLSLVDNWVAGKDISGEMHDAYGHEIALRAMLQFYNFTHYKIPMEQCGYTEKPSKSFFSKESEILTSNY